MLSFFRLAVVCFTACSSVGIANGYIPRVNFHARLEPDNQIIHGAGQDPEGFNNYRKIFDSNHQPLLYMTYVGLNHSVDSIKAWGISVRGQLAAMGQTKLIPQIGLYLAEGNGHGGEITGNVVAGEFDNQISALAQEISSFERPVFIRIGYEFEGPWNGYNPATYSQAWIRIARVLRERGLKFATVWCVAGGSSGWHSMKRLMEFYPGNEWVDWWAVDLFSEDEFTRAELMEFLDAARDRHKPVMIGEMTPRYVGVLDDDRSWQRWFVPLFRLIKSRPEIKAISYINWEWKKWADKLGFDWQDWGDARLEENKTVRDRWIRELSDPVFLHARDTQKK